MGKNQSLQSVAAKIRCRYGTFLKKNQYEGLAACPTLTEFVSSLSGYKPFEGIGKLPAATLSGNTLADFLEKCYLDDLASLFTLENFLGSCFFQLPILQFTAEYLLSFARQYNTGKQYTYPHVPDFFGQRLPFSLKEFVAVREYGQVISLLAGHPFQKVMAANIPKKKEPINITALEEGLTEILVSTLQTEFLEKENHKDFTELFGLMIDLENLQKLLRCRSYFPTDKVPFFLEGGSIAPKQLREWYTLSAKQLEQTVKQTKYGWYVSSELPKDFALEPLVTNRCHKLLRTTNHIPTMLFAYCLLSKQQKDRLTILAKGIEYRMPPAKLLQLLAIQ